MNRLLSIAINNYPGEINDLRGCLKDQEYICDLFKNFDKIALHKDSSATIENVKSNMKSLIESSSCGDKIVIHYSGHGCQILDLNGDEADGYDEALCLYDGRFIDDDINDILSKLRDGVECLVILDSCFSGTATRGKNTRFAGIDFRKKGETRRKSIIHSDNMKWTVMSACREDQTAADAFIDNHYCGAFTYYLCKTAKKGKTIEQWYRSIVRSGIRRYEQKPTLEGNNLKSIYL
jgi:hypothetical protein